MSDIEFYVGGLSETPEGTWVLGIPHELLPLGTRFLMRDEQYRYPGDLEDMSRGAWEPVYVNSVTVDLVGYLLQSFQ